MSIINSLPEKGQGNWERWTGVFPAKIIEATRKYTKNDVPYIRLNLELIRKRATRRIFWFLFSRKEAKDLIETLDLNPEDVIVDEEGNIKGLVGKYLQVDVALVEGNDKILRERVIDYSMLPEELIEAQALLGGEIKNEELPF